MRPFEHFKFCPRCGQPGAPPPANHPFRCGACGFVYYFNPAIAAAALVFGQGDERALFIRRAKDPGKGKLAMPGGFIDFGETAEDALRREIREEVNLEITSLNFLCSQPNSYHYQDVTYPVLDLFFVARTHSMEKAAALDAVESLVWAPPGQIEPADLAFPSMRQALKCFLESEREAESCPGC